MYWFAIPLALLPAALHWWWTRPLVAPGAPAAADASAVLPERHHAIVRRVSLVSTLCTLSILAIARWHAAWILPVQFAAHMATTYRVRQAMFGETWSFPRFLSWRVRVHAGMFGLWWLVALTPALVAGAGPDLRWWITGPLVAVLLAWHHWNGQVLLGLLGATRLERPDLDRHFQRVFVAARVPTPVLWRAGAPGGMLANAFALITMNTRGVLLLDTLLDRLPTDEITAILAHEVAHLEQFHRRRMLLVYTGTTVLILLLAASAVMVSAMASGFEPWAWVISFVGVTAAVALRARRMQPRETEADLRAIELCGDPDALIRGLTRLYEINHLPRRLSAVVEKGATHPSLARRIRAIRDRAAIADEHHLPLERLVVPASEPGRCVLFEPHRIGFLWVDGGPGDAATVLDRATRVEMIAYDQLRELRLSAASGAIALVAVDCDARRWSMPISGADAARVQAALDRIDHLVVAPETARDLGIVRRAAVLVVVAFAAPYNALGAVLVPALLALRRPKRSMMLALAAALAGTAVASVNALDASVVRFVLLAILAVIVLLSIRRRPLEELPDAPVWIWIEGVGLLIPILLGVVFAVANAQDLFALHSALRDRAWFTAALGAAAVFAVAQTSRQRARRAGLSAALLATVSLVIGSPWFLLHAVADPLVAEMLVFSETTVPVTAGARRYVAGDFDAVQTTPDGAHFLLAGQQDATAEYDDEAAPEPRRFVAGAFDGWSRQIRAFDAAVIDNDRLLVLDRDHGSSRLRAEHLRSGDSVWTISLPDTDVSVVQAAPDGRWRGFARDGRRFARLEGHVGASGVTSARWTVDTDRQSYVDIPRNDGGSGALAVASLWEAPALTPLLNDWRETKRLLRVDTGNTIEIAASHLDVECPAPPIGATGTVCVSFDGRSSRFWRVDLSSGRLAPIGATPHGIWKLRQPAQDRIAGVTNGRPLLADLETRSVTTLAADTRCWVQDLAMAEDVIVAACSEPGATIVTRYRFPDRQP